jgi:hypothetical protein
VYVTGIINVKYLYMLRRMLPGMDFLIDATGRRLNGS